MTGARLKVALCHRSIAAGDAIGRDISGMYELCRRIGAIPILLCEDFSPQVEADHEVRQITQRAVSDIDLVIYHHSISWPRGEQLLADLSEAPVIFKYHNITPARFFHPFSPEYSRLCENGNAQTIRLIDRYPRATWLADSKFNRQDLLAMGLDPGRCVVVPPFNACADFLRLQRRADYAHGPSTALFVGRMAPNKGHRLMIEVLDRYVRLFSPDLVLRMAGGCDPALASYERALRSDVERRGLSDRISILGHLPDWEIAELFATSHVYLNFSEHEGFCVPLIEAQAAGLPIVSVRSGASGETLGPQQLCVSAPVSDPDFVYAARVVHEVLVNERLRNHVTDCGLANLSSRFLQEQVENQFLQAIAPVVEATCG